MVYRAVLERYNAENHFVDEHGTTRVYSDRANPKRAKARTPFSRNRTTTSQRFLLRTPTVDNYRNATVIENALRFTRTEKPFPPPPPGVYATPRSRRNRELGTNFREFSDEEKNAPFRWNKDGPSRGGGRRSTRKRPTERIEAKWEETKAKEGRSVVSAAIALLAWKSSYSGRGLETMRREQPRAMPPRESWLGERDENNSGRRILRHFAMRRDQ